MPATTLLGIGRVGDVEHDDRHVVGDDACRRGLDSVNLSTKNPGTSSVVPPEPTTAIVNSGVVEQHVEARAVSVVSARRTGHARRRCRRKNGLAGQLALPSLLSADVRRTGRPDMMVGCERVFR